MMKRKKDTFRMPYGWIAWGGICAMVESPLLSSGSVAVGGFILGAVVVVVCFALAVSRKLDDGSGGPWWWGGL